jgi:predicted nucleic acid-binding protein
MSEQDTYVRAKLAEISTSLERLTNTLNRTIDVVSRIVEIQDATTQITSAVSAISKKLDDIIQTTRKTPVASVSAAQAAPEPRSTASPLQAVLDLLDSQIREGAIASDLAVKINEAADSLAQNGGAGTVVVKMQRWTRILRTYGRVDPISPNDIRKLRDDLKDWQREVAKAQ